MSRFIVADVTDAKSIPQEFAMFKHWRKFPSVLTEHRYKDRDQLIAEFDEVIIDPIEDWERQTDKSKARENALRDDNAKLREALERYRTGDADPATASE